MFTLSGFQADKFECMVYQERFGREALIKHCNIYRFYDRHYQNEISTINSEYLPATRSGKQRLLVAFKNTSFHKGTSIQTRFIQLIICYSCGDSDPPPYIDIFSIIVSIHRGLISNLDNKFMA